MSTLQETIYLEYSFCCFYYLFKPRARFIWPYRTSGIECNVSDAKGVSFGYVKQIFDREEYLYQTMFQYNRSSSVQTEVKRVISPQ